jgi:hypothetical protein
MFVTDEPMDRRDRGDGLIGFPGTGIKNRQLNSFVWVLGRDMCEPLTSMGMGQGKLTIIKNNPNT